MPAHGLPDGRRASTSAAQLRRAFDTVRERGADALVQGIFGERIDLLAELIGDGVADWAAEGVPLRRGLAEWANADPANAAALDEVLAVAYAAGEKHGLSAGWIVGAHEAATRIGRLQTTAKRVGRPEGRKR